MCSAPVAVGRPLSRPKDQGIMRCGRSCWPLGATTCQVLRLIDKREPKATALLFRSGKFVVTGARSDLAVDYACKKFAAILGKLGNDTSRFE